MDEPTLSPDEPASNDASAPTSAAPTSAPSRTVPARRLVAVMVVAVIAVVGGGLVLLAGGDEPEAGTTKTFTRPGTPDEVVDAFLAAATAGDCDALGELVTDDVGGELDLAECEQDGEILADYARLTRTGPAVVRDTQASVVAEARVSEGSPFQRLAFFLRPDGGDDGWSIEHLTVADDVESTDDTGTRAGLEQVVDAWATAGRDQDCAAVAALATSDYLDRLLRNAGVDECGQSADFFGTHVPTDLTRSGEVVVVGDVGYVAGQSTLDRTVSDGSIIYQLRHQDRAWRIAGQYTGDPPHEWTLDDKAPEQVVAEFLAAFTARDCDALTSAVDEEVWGDANLAGLRDQCLFFDFPDRDADDYEPRDLDSRDVVDFTGATIVEPSDMNFPGNQDITVEGPAGRVQLVVSIRPGQAWRILEADAA